MEKKINEMARELCHTVANIKRNDCHKCFNNTECRYQQYAEILHEQGYRKQLEAEWKFGEQNGQRGWYCTNCFVGFTGENAEWIAKEHNYCPHCGAKMKGE